MGVKSSRWRRRGAQTPTKQHGTSTSSLARGTAAAAAAAAEITEAKAAAALEALEAHLRMPSTTTIQPVDGGRGEEEASGHRTECLCPLVAEPTWTKSETTSWTKSETWTLGPQVGGGDEISGIPRLLLKIQKDKAEAKVTSQYSARCGNKWGIVLGQVELVDALNAI